MVTTAHLRARTYRTQPPTPRSCAIQRLAVGSSKPRSACGMLLLLLLHLHYHTELPARHPTILRSHRAPSLPSAACQSPPSPPPSLWASVRSPFCSPAPPPPLPHAHTTYKYNLRLLHLSLLLLLCHGLCRFPDVRPVRIIHTNTHGWKCMLSSPLARCRHGRGAYAGGMVQACVCCIAAQPESCSTPYAGLRPSKCAVIVADFPG